MILKTFPGCNWAAGRCGEKMDKDLKNQGHGQKVISMNGPSVDGGTNKVSIQRLASSHLEEKGGGENMARRPLGLAWVPRVGVGGRRLY